MFISNLKQLRKEKGISQNQCSLETNIPLRTLQRYENGKSIGDSEYLCKLMAYYNISAEQMLEYNNLTN